MMSSPTFESLIQALITIIIITLFQVFLDHRRASQPAKHHDENIASLLAAISCLSSKFDQKQLYENQYRLEIRNKLKQMQSDINSLKLTLQSRPTENELFIRLHQNVLREVRELESNIKAMVPVLPPVVVAAAVSPVVAAAQPPPPPPPQRAPEKPTSAPDNSGIIVISDDEEEEDGDDMFAPGGDYNASEPWE